jgi:hypothetical protein
MKSVDKSYIKYINKLAILAMILQVLDGLYTYIGIRLFGSVIEGNPIIRFAVNLAGAELALISIKFAACLMISYISRVKSNQVFYMLIFVNFVYLNVVALWAYEFFLNFMHIRSFLNF